MKETFNLKKIPNECVNYSFPASDDETYTLKDLFMGKKYLVMYFYPKDSTPFCTIQGHHYSKNFEKFKDLNAHVVGVSGDNKAGKIKFAMKEGYQQLLIADENKKFCQELNLVKPKKMFGKTFIGIIRSSLIIDQQMNIIYHQVPTNHLTDASNNLKFLQSL